MVAEDFFAEPKKQSRIKIAIVTEYFDRWANVILPTVKKQNGRMSYVDLFAGKGRYDDGTESTPLLILRKAINNPDLRERLMTEFNDSDSETAGALKDAIGSLPGIESLRFKPKITNEEVGESTAGRFAGVKLPPTLVFADPFGFKGLSLHLIGAVTKDFGCDCIFFFHFNSINRFVAADVVRQRINQLFGQERAEQLRTSLEVIPQTEREGAIVAALITAIKSVGVRFVHPFSFKDEHSDRTSHHLILATKHPRGYELIKKITGKHSTQSIQGVASFSYDPAPDAQGRLVFETPLDDLQSLLLGKFVGETATVKEIHRRHNIDQPYQLSDYKHALRMLEEAGEITVDRLLKGRKGTFPDHVKVTFPEKSAKEAK